MSRKQDVSLGAGLLWIVLAAPFLGVSSSSDPFQAVKDTTTFICQSTIDRCKEQFSSSQSLFAKGRYCSFLRFTENQVTMQQCVVQNGFCTDREYNYLIKAMCGRHYKTRTNADRQMFYRAVNLTSDNCQRQLLSCVRNSFVATVSIQSQRYCDLVNSSVHHRDCQVISSRCSATDLSALQGIACIDSEPSAKKTFSDALVASNESCQTTIENCIANSDPAIAYTQRQNYCGLMSDKDSGVIRMATCLVQGGQCTGSDVREMEDAACKGPSVTYKKDLLMTVPWLYMMLHNLLK